MKKDSRKKHIVLFESLVEDCSILNANTLDILKSFIERFFSTVSFYFRDHCFGKPMAKSKTALF